MLPLSRRQMLGAAAALVPVLAAGPVAGQPSQKTAQRILFLHGRAQAGRSSEELRAEWMAALTEGARRSGHALPADLDVVVPFYGDRLEDLVAQYEMPLPSDITTRGDALQDEYLAFQEEAARDIGRAAGITDAQIDEVYGDNPREKGPANWEWVQAIIGAIDRASPQITQDFLERFLRDVFIYLQSPAVRTNVDAVVTAELDDRPTVVVAHSLGTVVAFNILRASTAPDVPLLVTLGSPLGINAIRRRFVPLRYPQQVGEWLNAFDPRDIVALNPLDTRFFPVVPEIENIADLINQTDNRHGISGYLDKPGIAGRILGQF